MAGLQFALKAGASQIVQLLIQSISKKRKKVVSMEVSNRVQF
jgi:hypothetical protein